MTSEQRYKIAGCVVFCVAASISCSGHAPRLGQPIESLGTGGASSDRGTTANGGIPSSRRPGIVEADAAALSASGGVVGSSSADSGEAAADGGSNPSEPTSTCGNGVRGTGEFCDGDDLHGADCSSFGYAGGTLGCRATCSFDFSGCTGTELCYDGLDNDGNKKKDCADPVCHAACTDPCRSAPLILDPGLLNGDTSGHAAVLTSSCLPPDAASGPEVVFRVIASVTGVLRAVLSSPGADFSLSVRRTCANTDSELACRDTSSGAGAAEALSVRVTEGDELFLVVDGADAGEAGTFNLEVHSSAIVCGNARLDPGEECDDGNARSGDGCSSTCMVEPDEREPNDAIATATPYTGAPFFGQIASASDVDVLSIAVTSPGTLISIDTLDLGDGSCVNLELDDRVELLSSDGRVLGSNDDNNGNFCASLTVTGLFPGTYYVRVTASGQASAFAYDLDVSKSP